MEADLGACAEQRLDEPRPEPAVCLRRGCVVRVERRPLGAEAAVFVARPRSLLFDARQVEEALGEVVALRTLPTVDPLPRLRVVGHVVAEADVARADRIQHPTGPTVDLRRNHLNALRTTRAR